MRRIGLAVVLALSVMFVSLVVADDRETEQKLSRLRDRLRLMELASELASVSGQAPFCMTGRPEAPIPFFVSAVCDYDDLESCQKVVQKIEATYSDACKPPIMCTNPFFGVTCVDYESVRRNVKERAAEMQRIQNEIHSLERRFKHTSEPNPK